MLIQQGNLWEFHSQGYWICIPTNGIVNSQGLLVMGKGVALEAAQRFPGLRANWGELVKAEGNQPIPYPPGRLISFPTKHHWKDPSDLPLIRASATKLTSWWHLVASSYTMAHKEILPLCLPKVGCGCGGLDWESQVEPILSWILNNNYMAVV